MTPGEAWKQACRDYRAAYAAYQNARPGDEFAATLQAWRDAHTRMMAAEQAMKDSAP
jgi:hypothetical protein